MRITRITDIADVLECIPFEQEIRNKGRDNTRISKMILLLKDMLPNPLFGCWIVYDEEGIVGYTMAAIVLVPSMEKMFIHRLYAKTKEVGNIIDDTLTQFAKDYKIKTAAMTVPNESLARVMERAFGWKQVSINLETTISSGLNKRRKA